MADDDVRFLGHLRYTPTVIPWESLGQLTDAEQQAVTKVKNALEAGELSRASAEDVDTVFAILRRGSAPSPTE